MNRVAVIGGGLAGLEFALHAAQKGISVHIYEAGPSFRKRHVNFDVEEIDGDKKTKYWTNNENWGSGGGINERLGGRSLCYHGVMLPLEDSALNSWPNSWRSILTGEEGLYEVILKDLATRYPELMGAKRVNNSLQHVTQAAYLTSDGKFCSYSPLYYLNPYIEKGLITVEKCTVAKIKRKSDEFFIIDKHGKVRNKFGFGKCVLAASAIINNTIISRSIEREIYADITDHFCVGIFVKVKEGAPVGVFRHQMLWSGYSAHHDIDSNIFVMERPRSNDGDRIIEFMAVMEQNPLYSSYSTLHCNPDKKDFVANIEANLSNYDKSILFSIEGRLVEYASQLLGVELAPLSSAHIQYGNSVHLKGSADDSRWNTYNSSLDLVNAASNTNIFARFSLPYGAFEHESCCHPISGNHPAALTEGLELTSLPGVYALGPGAFPRLGIANPAMTICAMSRWLAESI